MESSVTLKKSVVTAFKMVVSYPLSAIKQPVTFCKNSCVKDALNAAVTTVNKLEFDCM